MGTGWRRAFCTTVPRDRRETAAAETAVDKQQSPNPKLARSNPSTPRLRCITTTANKNVDAIDLVSPKLDCKTTPKCHAKSPRIRLGSNPSSPRSPFSILKNTLRLSRNCCGVCMQSVKTGQGMAIYTAECSHAFHFPCIASHVKKQNCLLLKSYADDEPLVTPKAGANFVPTREAVKDEEDEVEEFQGFFVNPISSSDDALASFNRDSRNVDVSLLPEAAVISQGRTHDTYAVVLKVKAPPPPHVRERAAARRAPIDLVTVLDVSGSMTGAKLEMLKRAMRLVISSLGSADRLSILAFSAAPKRLLPLMRMTPQGQRSARRIIDRLSCSHGCSMAEALKQATRVLEERRERNPVASIILLSDGHDDAVPANNEPNQRRGSANSTRFAHVEIPVHSSGFSREPAEDAFSKCVSGLLSVVVQDLRIQIGFATGSDPAEITAVYSCNERPILLGSGCIRLGDLYAEEEKELLVEIRVPATRVGSHHVISTKCCYKDPATGELIYGGDQALLVPRPQTVRSGSPRIERLRNAFISSRAVAESRRLIEHNELSSAMQLLSSARALLLQSRSEFIGDCIKGLEAEMAEVQWRRQYQLPRRAAAEEERLFVDENGEPLTPTSAWRAAEKLAKVAQMKNRVSDLHGFENARF
ncbi:hypothetical protein DH2020_035691 [Rehmannia glutinosa]|uniref:Uncharacterized protein n=1 Tax=Rehmannia glutinosa TaxID=99300 RepID=A0ABR0V7W9_REHGL